MKIKIMCVNKNNGKLEEEKEALRLLYNAACGVFDSTPVFDFILFTSIKDKNRKDLFEGDLIKDTLTTAVYEIKYGYCKKAGFTGWYCENEHQEIPINNDSGKDYNSQILFIGNKFYSK
jgi:hypothetical protein